MEFYLNGILQSTVSAAPFSYEWSASDLPNGSYSIAAKAYDETGSVGQSAAVTVTVKNPEPDKTAPTVTLASPATNSTVTGTTVINAAASDDRAVTRVDYFLNGALRASSNTSLYGFAWDTKADNNGGYTIAAGNMGEASPVTVTVFNDTAAPAVSIVSPANGCAAGTVAVLAHASDNVGVSKMEFYLNGALQSSATTAPYGFNWNTTAFANGTYTLSVKAYDEAGNVGESSVTVAVLNDTTAPTISFGSIFVSGVQVTVIATGSDDVAVTRMELYIDGSLKHTTASGLLKVSWNVSVGSHTVAVKAYDSSKNVQSASRTVTRLY